VGIDTVNLSASIGSITSHANGAWDWSFPTSDGPVDSQTMNITVTDNVLGVNYFCCRK
jgi:hypothetical protein